MTKFNPEGKEMLTFAECLEPAMGIIDQADADQYLKDYIAYMDNQPPRSQSVISTKHFTSKEICKLNIGYWSGYYNLEIQKRVQELFNCEHPIFGPVNNDEC